MIDLNSLNREIRDKILLKEESDRTFSNFISEDYTEELFKKLEERRNKNINHSYIGTFMGEQGVGKSYASLALAGILDPNFHSGKIYFDIEEAVNNRHKFKSHSCIIIDEQARLFGTDSVRVSIMLNTIKEQLRKKSIHMFYNSPTLKEEYHTSMNIFEVIFLDKVNKLSFSAYKTNELLTLGYVVIPHPLNFIQKNTLIAYERKKDEHLKSVLEGPKDMVEERAQYVMKHQYFVKAEAIYKKARGYIPYKILVQIVEKIYPEFKGSVIVYELADRVKCDKEINGDWLIFGTGKKEDK